MDHDVADWRVIVRIGVYHAELEGRVQVAKYRRDGAIREHRRLIVGVDGEELHQ